MSPSISVPPWPKFSIVPAAARPHIPGERSPTVLPHTTPDRHECPPPAAGGPFPRMMKPQTFLGENHGGRVSDVPKASRCPASQDSPCLLPELPPLPHLARDHSPTPRNNNGVGSGTAGKKSGTFTWAWSLNFYMAPLAFIKLNAATPNPAQTMGFGFLPPVCPLLVEVRGHAHPQHLARCLLCPSYSLVALSLNKNRSMWFMPLLTGSKAK